MLKQITLFFLFTSLYSFGLGQVEFNQAEKQSIASILHSELTSFFDYQRLLVKSRSLSEKRYGDLDYNLDQMNAFEDSLIKEIVKRSWYEGDSLTTVETGVHLGSDSTLGEWGIYYHLFEKLTKDYYECDIKREDGGKTFHFCYDWVEIEFSASCEIEVSDPKPYQSGFMCNATFCMSFKGKKKGKDIIKCDITKKKIKLFFSFNSEKRILHGLNFHNIKKRGYIKKWGECNEE